VEEDTHATLAHEALRLRAALADVGKGHHRHLSILGIV
jgi:hypothetical protein